MEDKKYLKIINNDGVEVSYLILTTFYLKDTGKNYVIYTDSDLDNDMDINIYASIYDPDDDSKLEEITSDMEWEYIEEILDSLQDEE